jgi:hypothetical protein
VSTLADQLLEGPKDKAAALVFESLMMHLTSGSNFGLEVAGGECEVDFGTEGQMHCTFYGGKFDGRTMRFQLSLAPAPPRAGGPPLPQ